MGVDLIHEHPSVDPFPTTLHFSKHEQRPNFEEEDESECRRGETPRALPCFFSPSKGSQWCTSNDVPTLATSPSLRNDQLPRNISTSAISTSPTTSQWERTTINSPPTPCWRLWSTAPAMPLAADGSEPNPRNPRRLPQSKLYARVARETPILRSTVIRDSAQEPENPS